MDRHYLETGKNMTKHIEMIEEFSPIPFRSKGLLITLGTFLTPEYAAERQNFPERT